MIYVPDTQLIRTCFKTHNTAGLKWGSHTLILYTTGEAGRGGGGGGKGRRTIYVYWLLNLDQTIARMYFVTFNTCNDVSLVNFYIILLLLPADCKIVRIISLIKLSLYAPTVNNEPVQPVQDRERNTARESGGYGMYSSPAI